MDGPASVRRLHAVVIGDTEIARLTCAGLEERGDLVEHLPLPTEEEVRSALTLDVDAVAVLIRNDVSVLRHCLLVEHVRPGIRLVATVFDRTLADQLVRVVPNCLVTSPAAVSVPSIAGACLADGLLAVERYGDGAGARALRDGPVGVEVIPYSVRRPSFRAVASSAAASLRPHDDATRILFLGMTGLLAVLVASVVLTKTVLHQRFVQSLYLATRVVATVGPDNVTPKTSNWYLLFSSGAMLLTIAFTAMFTAGVVNRLLSSRSVGIVGRRTVPARHHVVVVGLGQVGLRLALHLKALGVPVVVLERDPLAANLRLARASGIPVLSVHAEDRGVLRRLSLHRARALAAMGSDELDNIEVAINALADAPDLRVVLRAGEDEVIAETRSLFRIGEVCDVAALTAVAVMRSMLGGTPGTVYPRNHEIAAFDGVTEECSVAQRRCRCPA